MRKPFIREELRPDVVFCSGFLHDLSTNQKRISEVSEDYLSKSFQINAQVHFYFFQNFGDDQKDR